MVNFPYSLKKTEPAYDFGFYVYANPTADIMAEGNVVFNLLNFFQVTNSSRPKERYFELNYGYMAHTYYSKY